MHALEQRLQCLHAFFGLEKVDRSHVEQEGIPLPEEGNEMGGSIAFRAN